MGKTFVEILAENLPIWPEEATHAVVDKASAGNYSISFAGGGAPMWDSEACRWSVLGTKSNWLHKKHYLHSFGLSASQNHIATRAQWEAERDRIAKEDSLAHIASPHKHEAVAPDAGEDQALWDKVAIKSMIAYMSQPNAIGDVPIEEFVGWGTGIADAFMEERNKRMKDDQCK